MYIHTLNKEVWNRTCDATISSAGWRYRSALLSQHAGMPPLHFPFSFLTIQQPPLLRGLRESLWLDGAEFARTYMPCLHNSFAGSGRCDGQQSPSKRRLQDQRAKWAQPDRDHGMHGESLELLGIPDDAGDVCSLGKPSMASLTILAVYTMNI